MLDAHLVQERREPGAAAAARIVCGRRLHFWQNGDLAGRGTHGARIVARAAGAPSFPTGAPQSPLFHCPRPAPDPRCFPSSSSSNCARACPPAATRRPTAASRRCCSSTAATATRWCWDAHFLPWFAAPRLRRARAVAARPRRIRRRRGAVRRRPRRLRGRRRARRVAPAGRAGADRTFDGRRDRRAAAGDAPRARGGAARAGAAGRSHLDGRAACNRSAPITCCRCCSSIRRGFRRTCWRRCGRSISATTSSRRSCAEATRHFGAESPRALLDLSLRLHWQLPERGATPVLRAGRRRRPHLRRRTTCARRRGITASTRRSCRASPTC